MGIFSRPKPTQEGTRTGVSPSEELPHAELGASDSHGAILLEDKLEAKLDGKLEAEPTRQHVPKRQRSALGYGIDEAIELMRGLPKDNIELVVKVVKATLTSADVDVPAVIEDAKDRQADLESRVDTLKSEIVELEGQIATRRKDISELEHSLRETMDVRKKLSMAEQASSSGVRPKPTATGTTASGSGVRPRAESPG